MEGSDFENLKHDIRLHGQLNPIVLYQGMILDGGNRYKALIELGIEPRFTEYEGYAPIGFVLSANLHRRHLKEGQAAAIVALAQDWGKAHPSHRVSADKEKEACTRADLSTAKERATEAGVSVRTQSKADKLVKEGNNELAKEVATGEKTLNQALQEAGAANGKSTLTPEQASANKAKRKNEKQLQKNATDPFYVDPNDNNDNSIPDEYRNGAEARSENEKQQDILADLMTENHILTKEVERMKAIMEADDKLTALTAEVDRLEGLNRVLNESNNLYMRRNAVLIAEVNKLRAVVKKKAA